MTQEFLNTRESITDWLDKHEVMKYTLVPDEQCGFSVNVDGNVHLEHLDLEFIPVQFNNVSGHFDCSYNRLTTLQGGPKTVESHYFCNNNLLTSLIGSPDSIGKTFYCCDNQLTSLTHSPKSVGLHFDCSNNFLTSLQYCPEIIGGAFNCAHNQIADLEYCPQTVGRRHVSFSNNPLLGYIQDIVDFAEIYQIHKSFVEIKKEKELLGHSIITPYPYKYSKMENFKI